MHLHPDLFLIDRKLRSKAESKEQQLPAVAIISSSVYVKTKKVWVQVHVQRENEEKEEDKEVGPIRTAQTLPTRLPETREIISQSTLPP